MRRWLLILAACTKHDAPAPVVADAAAIDAPRPADGSLATIDAPAAPGATAVKLAAGGDSFCTVMSDRTVRCWGDNRHQQLGGPGAGVVTPALRGAVELALSGDTACALLDDHSVTCWGEIAWQGGAPTTGMPTGVLGVINVKQVFAGARRACARIDDGSLVCWGDVDAKGHVTTDGRRRQPTPVIGIDRVIAMGASSALRDDGSVLVWGADGEPARLAVTGAIELGERAGNACARTTDGLHCIGPSATCAACPPGQPCKVCDATQKCAACPGSPTCVLAAEPAPAPKKPEPASKKKPPPKKPPPKKKPEAAAPVPDGPPGLATAAIPLPSGTLALDAGWCVINGKHELACGALCGDKLTGFELGSSSAAKTAFKVAQVAGHCARLADGTVRCWDGNQLAAVTGIVHATTIAASSTRTCAIVDGAVWCWGANRLATQAL